MMTLKNLYIKWQVWRGKALDIWSKSPYPANVLSNQCSNKFRFEGVLCESMEGFLQSLKYQDIGKQKQICSMTGKNAKNMTSTNWQTDQVVWWKGSAINRQSQEFQDLIRKAYKAMFEQNERFRIALMSTRGINLYHSQGEQNPYKTILTESEFCSVLTEMRDSYDRNYNEFPQRKKRLYFDMDGVLVDFESALAKQDEQTLKEYEGRYDEIPGLFAQMSPMDGAIDAVHQLAKQYDCYILSTAPWRNPSAWSDKVIWVTKYLDDVFHKRMIITHCKQLCKGDILIDDRGKNGTSEFEGEWIQFGSKQYPNWDVILDYLLFDNRQ